MQVNFFICLILFQPLPPNLFEIHQSYKCRYKMADSQLHIPKILTYIKLLICYNTPPHIYFPPPIAPILTFWSGRN